MREGIGVVFFVHALQPFHKVLEGIIAVCAIEIEHTALVATDLTVKVVVVLPGSVPKATIAKNFGGNLVDLS